MRNIPIPDKYKSAAANFMESFSVTPWRHYVNPFNLIGNIYYIGDDFAGALLLDTEDGLIVIDTGMPTCAPYLVQNIWALGYNPSQIKILLHTHGHFDHLGATNVLKSISGAKIYMSHEDTDLLIENPELMLMGHTEMGWLINSVDVEMEDGDIISLGNTHIKCILTPGHTDGAMSFVFDIEYDNKTYKAAMFGGAGLITLSRDYLMKNFNSMVNREKYLASLERLEKIEGINVVLANHPDMNCTFEKQERKMHNLSRTNPFYNPEEWKRFIEKMRCNYQKMIEKEALI